MKKYTTIKPKQLEKISKERINYVQADGNYSILVLNNGQRILLSYPLIYIHSYLEGFVRLSKGVSVNQASIKTVTPIKSGFVVIILFDGSEFTSSRRRSKQIQLLAA